MRKILGHDFLKKVLLQESVRNRQEYAGTLREIKRLMDLDPRPGSPRAKRLVLLAAYTEAYEKKRFAI